MEFWECMWNGMIEKIKHIYGSITESLKCLGWWSHMEIRNSYASKASVKEIHMYCMCTRCLYCTIHVSLSNVFTIRLYYACAAILHKILCIWMCSLVFGLQIFFQIDVLLPIHHQRTNAVVGEHNLSLILFMV